MYAIYAYIDPPNHPNVGIYGSPMECLGYEIPILFRATLFTPLFLKHVTRLMVQLWSIHLVLYRQVLHVAHRLHRAAARRAEAPRRRSSAFVLSSFAP